TASAAGMNESGDDVLADAGFSGNEQPCVEARRTIDLALDHAQRAARSDEDVCFGWCQSGQLRTRPAERFRPSQLCACHRHSLLAPRCHSAAVGRAMLVPMNTLRAGAEMLDRSRLAPFSRVTGSGRALN